MSIVRLYVEKRIPHNDEARLLRDSLRKFLNIKNIDELKVVNIYDVEGVSLEELTPALWTVFAERSLDELFIDEYPFFKTDKFFIIESLPGQFDMRADSAIACVKVVTNIKDVNIRSSKLYILRGDITADEINSIKKYLINNVSEREASVEKPYTLKEDIPVIEPTVTIDDFSKSSCDRLAEIIGLYNLSMSLDDIKFAQSYFKKIGRNPTVTEIKILDTYWSDHCRHTTFNTELTSIDIEDGRYKKIVDESFSKYLSMREEVFGKDSGRAITLMDMATISSRYSRKKGYLDNLEISDESNACSIEIDVELLGGGIERWLLQFKNETHNHPTEIEPFGGAATCLGGAIRDPLSGRAYVYQAMRLTGASNPLEPISKTLNGKLPQIKITREAAKGYSSYGNQIGIPTGIVKEFYHDGFKAKRMEVGAVIGAVKKSDIIREKPLAGDMILLLGGRTGRDGVGGATGSSKEQDHRSIDISSAEVQKGNAPEEHKLQRLFRKPAVSKMIKKSNDFGAGGVSVAIGELADGVKIYLDRIKKKYDGLNATELALSESQERIAVVINRADYDAFIAHCATENIEVTHVADVIAEPKMVMGYNDEVIADIDREFLDSSGAKRTQSVIVKTDIKDEYFKPREVASFYELLTSTMRDMNISLQVGLVEMFDSSVGASTVLSPFGGEYQLTESEAMIAKIPVLNNDTETVSIMAHGYNPHLSESSPFHGGYFAVIESVTKVISAGGRLDDIRLSFQEYFERLGNDANKWGNPFLSLLGAMRALNDLKLSAIGGKDSMSGTYIDKDSGIEITVPPTLISFAVAPSTVSRVITPEFKDAEKDIYLIKTPFNKDNLLNIKIYKERINLVNELIESRTIRSIYTIKVGGVIEAVAKSAIGNKIGVKFDDTLSIDELSYAYYGSFIVTANFDDEFIKEHDIIKIGRTVAEEIFEYKDSAIYISDIIDNATSRLEPVFPSTVKLDDVATIPYTDYDKEYEAPSILRFNGKPSVAILALPGTNCEYDTKNAFERAGSNEVTPFIFRNLTIDDIEYSCKSFAKLVDNSQILAIPGGFSAGDEPEGSGKFYLSIFMQKDVRNAIDRLINERGGLAIGICNGFQALIKSGLITYGYINELKADDPTLSFNKIGRHVSRFVRTRVASVKSPWLALRQVGEVDNVVVSHGEGRFTAPVSVIRNLLKEGRIPFQYVDIDNNITLQYPDNPNGSDFGVEAMTSLDGRVLGKMAHSERVGYGVHLNNRYGNLDQLIFKAGIEYFI